LPGCCNRSQEGLKNLWTEVSVWVQVPSPVLKTKHMHSYFRNHQLYLAERNEWLDRHVVKTSKRALMKITCLNQCENEDESKRLIEKMVKESLLTGIPNKTILSKEGFFLSNLKN
jgi:hypothetical protein